MNKRQKKKFIKKNMIKLRKIHPDKGDVVVLQFDPGNEYIDLDTIFKFYRHGKILSITVVLLLFHAM